MNKKVWIPLAGIFWLFKGLDSGLGTKRMIAAFYQGIFLWILIILRWLGLIF
jgi:hypothetical protein